MEHLAAAQDRTGPPASPRSRTKNFTGRGRGATTANSREIERDTRSGLGADPSYAPGGSGPLAPSFKKLGTAQGRLSPRRRNENGGFAREDRGPPTGIPR